MDATASAASAGPHGSCLLVVTGARVAPETLDRAIVRAYALGGRIDVLIPAVLPPTLPISALPSHLAQRLNALRSRAIETFARLQACGRIDIVPTRDVCSALRAASTRRPDEVILAGTAGWRLRRTAHGIAPVTVVSDRASRSRGSGAGVPHERAVVTEL
jgi:hypothetical protein